MPKIESIERTAEILLHTGGACHRLRLSRPMLLGLLACVLLGIGWTLALTGYVLFRDELLAEMLDRNTRLQQAYEGRIDALKAEAERVRSQAMLDAAKLDRALLALGERQAQLEKRHLLLSRLAGVPADTTTGSEAGSAPPLTHELSRPRPLDDGAGISPGRTSALQEPSGPPRSPAAALADRLAALDRAQGRMLHETQQRVDERIEALRGVTAQLGLGSAAHGVGGPLLLAAAAVSFDERVAYLAGTRADLAAIEGSLARVPLRQPIPGAGIASPFGQRLDPFFRIPAYHAGLDFEAGYGTTVLATAPGRVTIAGANGGYGLMVEVDHGGGITTRYGHLSAIDVGEGMEVGTGTPIGRAGSTGRSTGPHLHYETRVRGEPIDPLRFLAAGRRLAALD